MRSVGLFVIGHLVIFLSKVIYPFFKFKICYLRSSRIGQLTINFDIAYLKIPDNYHLLVFHEKAIANKFVLNFFSEQKKVFISKFFSYLYYAIQYLDSDSHLIYKWLEYQPKFTFHYKKNSKIIFPKIDKSEIQKTLFNNEKSSQFVGLHARNNLYLKKNKIEDKNNHNFRNFDFNDYTKTIDYLQSKKINIIKLGEHFNEENSNLINDKNIITSSKYFNNAKIDYFLNAYSKYNIIGNSGIVGISSILRKKIVYANFIPMNLFNLSYCSPGSLILPKKLFSKEKNRLLTFKEMNQIDFDIHTNSDPYKSHQIEVINNTPNEILNVTIEMDDLIDGKTSDIKKKKELNDIFWQNISEDKFKTNYLRNELKLSISKDFLEQNQELLL